MTEAESLDEQAHISIQEQQADLMWHDRILEIIDELNEVDLMEDEVRRESGV